MNPTETDFWAVRDRIAPYIHETPVHTCGMVDERARAEVFLKCELFQRMGAFKMRGATNLIMQLSDEERGRGVIAHSSGNHAQAVALAARNFGTSAIIVMPETAPAVKVAATKGYGAEVVQVEPTTEALHRRTAEIIAETGRIKVPPYDHDDIIMGAGTTGLELMRQVEGLDTILVPISGGGLISGVALAAHAVNPDIKVIACEPANADDAYQSFRAGKRIQKQAGQTLADGLRAQLSDRTFAIVKKHVSDVILLSEEEIRETTLFLWQRTKLLAEPSGATALAPLFHHRDQVPGQRVGVILSGGNVDMETVLAS